MKILSLNLVVRDENEGVEIARQFYDSHISGLGIYCLGDETRELTPNEMDELEGQLPLDD